MWLAAALSIGFLAYLLYTHQIKWLLGVLRNAVFGVAGILVCNLLLSKLGLMVVVGINPLTTLIAGLLGGPGVLLLYAAQALVG